MDFVRARGKGLANQANLRRSVWAVLDRCAHPSMAHRVYVCVCPSPKWGMVGHVSRSDNERVLLLSSGFSSSFCDLVCASKVRRFLWGALCGRICCITGSLGGVILFSFMSLGFPPERRRCGYRDFADQSANRQVIMIPPIAFRQRAAINVSIASTLIFSTEFVVPPLY